MANADLKKARRNKNDEFYTQYPVIQQEMNAYVEYNSAVFRGKTVLLPCDDPEWSNFTKFFVQNFERFGLKKLISTSYAGRCADERGRLFLLEEGKKALEWVYLEGDGDFRSDEVKVLRDEADIIVTNPPFSMFREFLDWIVSAGKQFIIIGNVNALTYKEVFPLIKNNEIWLGESIHGGDREFRVPVDYPLTAAGYRIDEDGNHYIRVKGVRWFTNIEHGLRHKRLQLMSMEDNIKFSKHKEVRNVGYAQYDNYNAIEIPFTDAIPEDYEGYMGVPITFLDKYNPEQFELLGIMNTGEVNEGIRYPDTPHGRPVINGVEKYLRVIIKRNSSY